MRIGLSEALVGLTRSAARCPACGSSSVRRSRRSVDGPWRRLLAVGLARCESCGIAFTLRTGAPLPSGDTGPLRPARPRAKRSASSRRSLRPSRCPECGSSDIETERVVPGAVRTALMRLSDRMRCVSCNATFESLSVVRSLAYLFAVGSLVGAISWGLTRGDPGSPSDRSPRVRKVPTPPPPVLNR